MRDMMVVVVVVMVKLVVFVVLLPALNSGCSVQDASWCPRLVHVIATPAPNVYISAIANSIAIGRWWFTVHVSCLLIGRGGG